MINKLAPFLLGLIALSSAGAVSVSDLRCEHLQDPQGIDVPRPRLSWILRSNERNTSQTAFQILVASSAANLKADRGDLWDSGRVGSDQSIETPYSGAPLSSFNQCFWKVRVWDQDGRASAWSEPALWTMGVLSPGDWHAQWIGLDETDRTNELTGTDWIWQPQSDSAANASGEKFFRRVFSVPADRRIRRARLWYAADSDCTAYFNGRDLGNRSGYKTCKEIELTPRIEPGTNILAISARKTGSSSTPAGLVALLEVEFDRGEPLTLKTDAQWKSGDRADHWNEPGFDDSRWVAAVDLGPVGGAPWGQVLRSESRRLSARWIRKEFNIGKPIRRATVSYSGLGWSELYLNGEKIGDHVLSPGLTEYSNRVFYITFDVTRQLRRGANAVGAILGNGRYYAARSRFYANTLSYGYPKLLLHLRIDHTDGTTSDLVSDTSWKLTTDGPIVANNEYDGEEYDARNEIRGWAGPGLDDLNWRQAEVVTAPQGAEVAQMMEPIRVVRTLKPIAVTEPKPGMFIFDLGQNMVGWCRLKVSGPAGTQVSLRHAETLKPDGTLYLANIRGALVTDRYTLKGKGTEVWEPRFTCHGFRYVEVTGFPGKPTLESIEGRVVSDDLESAGEFTCSNPLLNRIYQNVVWGTRGNYHSIPTDCPQRDERQGWMGDRSEESRGETYIFDNIGLETKWLQDMRDSQRASGSVPDVCPPFWPIYSDDVTWPSTTVILPAALRDQFGDQTLIGRHYESARRWVDYMLQFVNDGLISKDKYGDWCMPPEDAALIHSKDPNRITDKTLLATSYFYHDLRLMESYARRLGKAEDARRYGTLADAMKEAFNKRFLNRELGQYDNGTQTSCVLPLAFGLVPDDVHDRIFAHLVDKITGESKGHIGTGLIGGQYLNRVLTQNGRADLAYNMAAQKTYPSWGYMVEQGATTIWELWNGNTADPAMNSGNHVMLVGDLVIWLYEDLAGIKPDSEQPGFKHIVMKPRLVGDLSYVQATHRSPYGLISSEWRRDGGKFDWQIQVPANATATIFVPAKSPELVKESGDEATRATGLTFQRMDGDYAVFHAGSGSYHFVAR